MFVLRNFLVNESEFTYFVIRKTISYFQCHEDSRQIQFDKLKSINRLIEYFEIGI